MAVLLGLALGLVALEVGLRLASEPEEELDQLAELAAGLEPPARLDDCRGGAPQARLREIVSPSPRADLIYEFRPGVETCFEGAPVAINSQGVRRSTQLDVPKPDGVYRVLILGDSHAFGWAIPEDETVAAQLEEVLEAEASPAVEVINAGVPGFSAYQEAAWLAAYGAGLEPNCVIVLFVANDMGLPHFLLRPRKPGRLRLWDRLKTVTGSKRWFSFAPNELATFVSEVDMERIPDRYRHMVGEAGYREALRKMAGWAAENGADLVNVFDYATLDVDSEALVGFQEDLGVTALEMPWPTDPAFRVSKADPHLNREGNARVVEFLLEALERESTCLPPDDSDGTALSDASEADAPLGEG